SVPSVKKSNNDRLDCSSDIEIECGTCALPRKISEKANNFVCDSCKSVNRVVVYPLGDRGVDVVVDPSCVVPRQRGSADAFQMAERGSVLPCSICLDSTGDCVLLPCNHGGFCQVCSVHVGSNLAVGGRHCPKCREYIQQIVRVGRVHELELKGNPVALPVIEDHQLPPKVNLRCSKEGEKSHAPPSRGETATTIASSSNGGSPNPSEVAEDEENTKVGENESSSEILPRAFAFEQSCCMVGKRKRNEVKSEKAASEAPTRAGKGRTVTQETKKKPAKTEPRVGEMFYLIKSEPESRFENGMDMKFSIDDLVDCPNSTAEWDGVRNYQARNLMREMKIGDKAFFYHSNCKPPGIVGIVEVVREAYPDDTQFDAKNPHYDPRSSKEEPKWDMVDVKFIRKLERKISLDELKKYRTKQLSSMGLFTTARLSVQRVTPAEWQFILSLENEAC
ncbi:Thymocyte nuclear protein 1, partial [Perkinsus chesapeaki]